MATWPTSLPQEPKLRGYTETRESNVLRSPTEQGPAKTRKLYTADIPVFSIVLVMTDAQLTTFDTFFESTIDYGATSFTWVHPRTGSGATCRLRSVPNLVRLGGDYWSVSFQMEILP